MHVEYVNKKNKVFVYVEIIEQSLSKGINSLVAEARKIANKLNSTLSAIVIEHGNAETFEKLIMLGVEQIRCHRQLVDNRR